MADDARALLNGYSLTASAVYEGGATDYSAFRSSYAIAPRGVGIRYTERNGLISGTLAGVLVGLVIAAGGVAKASGPKKVETWETDTRRYTKTTMYSEDEKAAINQRTSSTASGAGGAFIGSPTQSLDVVLYSRNLGGDVSGYHASLTFFSFLATETSRLDLGLMFGSVETATQRDGKNLLTGARSLGIPMRYNQVLGPVLTYLHFDWNWLGMREPSPHLEGKTTLSQDVRNMPWRLGASAAIFHRLYLDVAATTPRLMSGDLGFSASVGARF